MTTLNPQIVALNDRNRAFWDARSATVALQLENATVADLAFRLSGLDALKPFNERHPYEGHVEEAAKYAARVAEAVATSDMRSALDIQRRIHGKIQSDSGKLGGRPLSPNALDKWIENWAINAQQRTGEFPHLSEVDLQRRIYRKIQSDNGKLGGRPPGTNALDEWIENWAINAQQRTGEFPHLSELENAIRNCDEVEFIQEVKSGVIRFTDHDDRTATASLSGLKDRYRRAKKRILAGAKRR